MGARRLGIHWGRQAGKTLRQKLRNAGIKVSESAPHSVNASLELVVEWQGKTYRVRVPSDYLLLAPADVKTGRSGTR